MGRVRTFGKAFNIQEEDLSFSNGWLYKFKKHNNIRKYCIHEKLESALLASLPEDRRAKLKEIQTGDILSDANIIRDMDFIYEQQDDNEFHAEDLKLFKRYFKIIKQLEQQF
ncbi:hypothetical protein RhiirA4_421980 [Rhizophagus irregularis]|uniref:HTH CENPB-type domain-containing protein n=1 Tax=Rhizophagus irregularis TaxID=588596 RepID=A0A2I1GNT0_9GLOM|nr:hypothetical protein RhiirA4_421980 [Rhizophagus irregularis]